METSTLRWILIIIGVLVLVSIRVFFNPEKKRKPKASRLKEEKARKSKRGATRGRKEPTLEGTAADESGQVEPEFGSTLDDTEPGDQQELAIGDKPGDSGTSAAKEPAGPMPDKIVTVFLLARDNHVITGAELLQATVSTGMEFGTMGIFHRNDEGMEKPVFSMANAAKPGHFERDEWNTFETNGVVLFLTLPGPMQALDAWDAMLATARRMGEILQAELMDDERNPFTRQKEAQVREEMRDYDRSFAPSD